MAADVGAGLCPPSEEIGWSIIPHVQSPDQWWWCRPRKQLVEAHAGRQHDVVEPWVTHRPRYCSNAINMITPSCPRILHPPPPPSVFLIDFTWSWCKRQKGKNKRGGGERIVNIFSLVLGMHHNKTHTKKNKNIIQYTGGPWGTFAINHNHNHNHNHKKTNHTRNNQPGDAAL